MKHKYKIFFFVIIISTIITIFCISSYAYEYSDYYGLIILSGTSLTFKNTPDVPLQNVTINFKVPNTSISQYTFNYIYNKNNHLSYHRGTDDWNYAYDFTNGTWGMLGRTIVISNDYVLQDNYTSHYLIDNMISGIPEPQPPPPDPMDTVYEDGQTFLSNTTTNLNTIISFIVTNPVITVFTIGIFIISITVGILYRLNNKTTRKKS